VMCEIGGSDLLNALVSRLIKLFDLPDSQTRLNSILSINSLLAIMPLLDDEVVSLFNHNPGSSTASPALLNSSLHKASLAMMFLLPSLLQVSQLQ
jgi:hypothetical protein